MNIDIRRSLTSALLTGLITVLASSAMSAQQQSIVIPNDAAFQAFLAFQAAAANRAEKIRINDPGRATRMQYGMRDLLHISADGQNAVAQISRSVINQLQVNSTEVREYIIGERKAGRHPDRAIMQHFALHRAAILQNAQAQLKGSLSDKDWRALSAYIHGESSAHLRAYPINRQMF